MDIRYHQLDRRPLRGGEGMNYDEYDRWWNHEMSQRKGKGLRIAKLKTTSKQKVWGLIKKIQSMTPNDFLASSHPMPSQYLWTSGGENWVK